MQPKASRDKAGQLTLQVDTVTCHLQLEHLKVLLKVCARRQKARNGFLGRVIEMIVPNPSWQRSHGNLGGAPGSAWDKGEDFGKRVQDEGIASEGFRPPAKVNIP